MVSEESRKKLTITAVVALSLHYARWEGIVCASAVNTGFGIWTLWHYHTKDCITCFRSIDFYSITKEKKEKRKEKFLSLFLYMEMKRQKHVFLYFCLVIVVLPSVVLQVPQSQ